MPAAVHRGWSRCAAPLAVDAVTVALAVLLTLSTAMLLVRRAADALVEPLPAGALLACGLAAALVVAMARIRWQLRRPVPPNAPIVGQIEAATSAVLFGFALALSVPGSSLLGLSLLWSPVLFEIAAGWLAYRNARQQPTAPLRLAEVSAVDESSASTETEPLQQLTRTLSADGLEEIAGVLRLTFAAGQRSGNLHVAFCPPLAGVPHIEFEQTDGPEARIKLGQSQCFGARFEIKLLEPADEPTSVAIEFVAHG